MLFFLHIYGTKNCYRHKHKNKLMNGQTKGTCTCFHSVMLLQLSLPLYSHYCSTLLMLLLNVQYELILASYKNENNVLSCHYPMITISWHNTVNYQQHDTKKRIEILDITIGGFESLEKLFFFASISYMHEQCSRKLHSKRYLYYVKYKQQ